MLDFPTYPIDRKPPWLRAKIPGGKEFSEVHELVRGQKLHTVCESAHCPNLGECWARGTATVMILGNTCTRACGFCAVNTGRPTELDLDEPVRVAEAIKTMRLRHVVITSVARDELADGGAMVWNMTIKAVRRLNPKTSIEVLIPDLKGNEDHLDLVLQAKPDILNHNLETVARLHRKVRPAAKYDRSLEVLSRSKAKGFITKTGLMLGIGEWPEEIEITLQDIAQNEVNVLTLGQYLRPTSEHLPIDRWVHPDEFAYWKKRALELGINICESGPLVRSSYHADEQTSPFTGAESLHIDEGIQAGEMLAHA